MVTEKSQTSTYIAIMDETVGGIVVDDEISIQKVIFETN